MKRFVVVLAQFLLFLLVFAAGSFLYHPFHIETALDGRTRSFVWDGVLLLLLTYGVVLLIELLRKRLRTAGPWTSLALVLAGLAGWAMKFGFVTHNW
jgi:hypothetical protein